MIMKHFTLLQINFKPWKNTALIVTLPWLGGTEIRCWICCEDADEEDKEVALERGQPRVPGAERGRELVAEWCPIWWVALG